MIGRCDLRQLDCPIPPNMPAAELTRGAADVEIFPVRIPERIRGIGHEETSNESGEPEQSKSYSFNKSMFITAGRSQRIPASIAPRIPM